MYLFNSVLRFLPYSKSSSSSALIALCCILVGLFAIGPAAAQEGEDDVISVDSDLVLVNATVTDKQGAPQLGLSKNSFRVIENGAEQKIDVFETEEAPFAAVILLDTSGSMETRVSLARSAAMRFLYGIRADDRVAIYNFDSKLTEVQEFSNLRDLVPGVYDLKASGMTILYDAIYDASLKLGKRKEKRRAIVVLSDGADTKSGRSASKALKAALDAGATIYTVDMSRLDTGGRERMQNRGVLKNFAEKTGGRFIETPGGAELREAFTNIVKELGVQYTLGYYPANSKRDGKWREINVEVSGGGLSVRARKGYNAPKN